MELDPKIVFEESAVLSRFFFGKMSELWDAYEEKYGVDTADSILMNVVGNLTSQVVARSAGSVRGNSYSEEESRPMRNAVKKAVGKIFEQAIRPSAGPDTDYTFERHSDPPK